MDIPANTRCELNIKNGFNPSSEILKSEMMHSLYVRKCKKAPNDFPMEVLKLIDEDNINPVVSLFNATYWITSIGEFPDAWFIPMLESAAGNKMWSPWQD